MNLLSSRLLQRLLPAAVVVAWLVIAAITGPLAGKLSTVQTNNQVAFLPTSAEATQAAALLQRFSHQNSVPAVVVYTGETTTPLLAKARADARAIGRTGHVSGTVAGPVASRDGQAVRLVIPISASVAVPDVVKRLRDLVASGLPPGAHAYVTGPAGFTTDLGAAFTGVDGILLLVAGLVVLAILVLVYRSPILPFAVLMSALLALAVASGMVYALTREGALTLNGQSQGILFILVVGAATDYALLLVSRYREELREHESKYAAMAVAWRQATPPITASGMTVALALLCLLLSNLNSTRSLGPIGALGIVGALFSTLTFLPAVLLLLGRTAFWPKAIPAGSPHPERSGVWEHLARLVAGHPRRLWVGTGVGLAVLAAFLPTMEANGTSQADLFLRSEPSVTGQQVEARHFPGDTGLPAVIIGHATKAPSIIRAAADIPGINGVTAVGSHDAPVGPRGTPQVVGGLAQVQATLQAPADSKQAIDTVLRLRAAVHRVDPSSKVGGTTAITLDTQLAAKHDRALIIPIVLLVIFVLLLLLLRAVVAALLLLATVVLSFAATLGVSALVFNHLLSFPGADPSVPLFGFIFLVALGVDYNIFLMSRVREESARHGTRRGVHVGLVTTGGVITSAGVVLAATFAALSVIPLLFLAQIAFIVAFGVLLDTLVVRSILVPALVYDARARVWWPSRLARGRA